jgi:hypothetical protein
VNRHRAVSEVTGLGAEAGFPSGTSKRHILASLTRLYRIAHGKDKSELVLVEQKATLPKREK